MPTLRIALIISWYSMPYHDGYDSHKLLIVTIGQNNERANMSRTHARCICGDSSDE